ncbi:TetR/AcrR family transcriptional regulator [Prauserella flavalba]|uniref:HTH tetR-type domain-containing protein n=1 Tax=Prauserella flavalba TaxID=1477506 RepID=A0A318LTI6_9PSEU|nr:TetR family transcriptional regulator C-terminal domain-containing protein [Prauserella flavalba]PXY36900.1 hypothetical protein BA062_10820 [Prauserella flavalba]
MPKRVDHEQRRREIAEALWRVAAVEGLRAVTLRRVAAEAGISMNLVQYYFTTKDEMVRYGLARLTEVASARIQAELAEVLPSRDPKAILRACLVGVLPVDEHSRRLSTVHGAYLTLSITDPEIAALNNRIPHELASRLVPVLTTAQDRGTVHKGLDVRRELDSLLAMVSGLAPGILIGTYTAAEAVELVDYRLDRLFS